MSFDRPARAAYAKLRHPASHFAIVGVAASLTVEDGVCTGARVAVTGASTHAQRLGPVEDALRGSRLDGDAIAAASDAADVAEVNSDLSGSEAYRRVMTRVFTGRAIAAAAAR